MLVDVETLVERLHCRFLLLLDCQIEVRSAALIRLRKKRN